MQRIAALGVFWSLLAPGAALQARDLYVNPRTGIDSADGGSQTASDGHGPLKTIDRAIRVAEPGDTVHLAKATYTEPVGIYGTKSGLPGQPITVDGHDAVISGCVPLELANWTKVAPGLYRNETLFKTALHSQEEFVDRFSFVIDGGAMPTGTCTTWVCCAWAGSPIQNTISRVIGRPLARTRLRSGERLTSKHWIAMRPVLNSVAAPSAPTCQISENAKE